MSLLVSRLRCESLLEPCGLDVVRPRLSWQVCSDEVGTRQAGYQVLVSSSEELVAAGCGDLWDSGRVESDDCVLVPYSGVELTSRARAVWTVRIWDQSGRLSPYAASASWEMGLLRPEDWQARWIAGHAEPGGVSYLRRTVTLRTAGRGRVYATALGLYELHVNGVRAGTARFTPGWTDYARRLQYQVVDVSDLLVEGENHLMLVLADGWYAGRIGWMGGRAHYGDTPQVLMQLEVDGDVVAVSDGNWSSGEGPLRSSCLLAGETYDATWTEGPARPAREMPGTAAARVCSPAPPVRAVAELVPMSVQQISADSHLVDLGQNVTGVLRLCLAGDAGRVVLVRHGEVLDDRGQLYVENLRSAEATDTFVLGAKATSYEPRMTFHGFRYAEVTGYPHPLAIHDVTGIVLGTDLEETGHFSCSDPRVDRLHANIVWGARGNFLDVPTDCPQRDERMGWTGDAQVFAPTASYLFDVHGFFVKWLRDLADTQTPDGSLCDVAPRVLLGSEGSAGWADAGVLLPWAVSQWFGDDRLLEEAYPVMRRWVDHVHRANPELVWLHARGYDNGDWLQVGADTDKDLLATAYFAQSANVTALAAERLGRSDEARWLRELAEGVRAAFHAAFVLPDGRLKSETQTAYALALRFGLVPDELRDHAVAHLVANVEANEGRLTCGFLGVAHLLPALTDGGRVDVAYRLLLEEGFPSWLHAVSAGATTVWERWDGWRAEAGFQDPAMNSFNHYALGAVGEWLYRTVAGIDCLEPAGRRLRLAPRPGPGLDWARARWMSPLGLVACGWQRHANNDLTVEVDVPVGASARLVLPDHQPPVDLESGHHLFTVDHTTQGTHHAST